MSAPSSSSTSSPVGICLQIRRDTAANWSALNPILLDGEFGYDQTNKLIKIGDGVTPWNDLPALCHRCPSSSSSSSSSSNSRSSSSVVEPSSSLSSAPPPDSSNNSGTSSAAQTSSGGSELPPLNWSAGILSCGVFEYSGASVRGANIANFGWNNTAYPTLQVQMRGLGAEWDDYSFVSGLDYTAQDRVIGATTVSNPQVQFIPLEYTTRTVSFRVRGVVAGGLDVSPWQEIGTLQCESSSSSSNSKSSDSSASSDSNLSSSSALSSDASSTVAGAWLVAENFVTSRFRLLTTTPCYCESVGFPTYTISFVPGASVNPAELRFATQQLATNYANTQTAAAEAALPYTTSEACEAACRASSSSSSSSLVSSSNLSSSSSSSAPQYYCVRDKSSSSSSNTGTSSASGSSAGCGTVWPANVSVKVNFGGAYGLGNCFYSPSSANLWDATFVLVPSQILADSANFAFTGSFTAGGASLSLQFTRVSACSAPPSYTAVLSGSVSCPDNSYSKSLNITFTVENPASFSAAVGNSVSCQYAPCTDADVIAPASR